MTFSPKELLDPVRRLHEKIRAGVVTTCEKEATEFLSMVAAEEDGDTIYAVDRVSEEMLVEFFEKEIAPRTSVVLIA